LLPWDAPIRPLGVYVHHASPDEPQYEIKSEKTDHIALHKGGALRRLSR